MKPTYKEIFWSSLGLKLVLAVLIPVTMDEYYYFLWGQHLSLSYFDHPPMVGWLMTLSQPLKIIAEGAIRWPFLLLTHATLYVWDLILRDQLDERRRFTFLLIGILNPLWGWGAFIATPDIPLVFFWSLALLFAQQILKNERWLSYIGLAGALGFGFLSKYHVALFLPCLLLMLWQQNQLHKLIKPKAWVSVLIAIVFCSPVFIWNAQHEWASINFQWQHGMAFKYWKWTLPLEYLISQIFIIFPTFLVFLFQKPSAWTKNWLAPFALLPFGFFLYSSFKGRVEANWVIMSLPCVFALSSLFTSESQWNYCRKTIHLWAALFLFALILIPLKSQLPENRIKLFEADRYAPLLPEIGENESYYAFSYQLASYLSFKKNRLICKFPGYGRPDHFQFIEDCPAFENEFFYITEYDDNRTFSDVRPDFFIKSEEKVTPHFKFVKIGVR